MSYQVLARKWRPATFEQMVGQAHVLKALVNSLDQQRLHHAYLFTGTRGVGKTTIARLLAKSLNCEVGVSSKPCGQCSACTEIAEGRFVDLIEVDAASRTRVEDTRELLENVQYAPTRGRYKVYLIDEVHMLSVSSFNALLKTLEEPPPHVKFLLATTDPQKLPVTVLSRCLQFNLKNMTRESIVSYLNSILGQEQVPFDEPALWLLAEAASGSMRDALSLTDQAIAYGEGELNETDVATMLGTVDLKRVLHLVKGLIEKDADSLMQQVAGIAEHAPDYRTLLNELLSTLHRVAIAQAAPSALDNSKGDREAISALATQAQAEDIHLFYQIGTLAAKDLALAPSERAGFEMALLRMLAFSPSPARSLADLPALESRVAAEVGVEPPKQESGPQAPEEPDAPLAPQPERQSEPHMPVVSDVEAGAVGNEPQPLEADGNGKTEAVPPEPEQTAATTAEPETRPGLSETEAPAEESEAATHASTPAQSASPAEQAMGTGAPDQASGEDELAPWEGSDDDADWAPAPHAVADLLAEQPATAEPAAVPEPVAEKPTPKPEETVPAEPQSPAPVSETEASLVADSRQSVEPSSPVAHDPNQLIHPETNPARWPDTDRQADPVFWWQVTLHKLGLSGMTKTLFAHSTWAGFENSRLQLIISDNYRKLMNETHIERLMAVLGDFLPGVTGLDYQFGVAEKTPQAWFDRLHNAAYDMAVAALHQDPFVQSLVSRYDGNLQADTVKAAYSPLPSTP
ncbi:DNA polymerase III subunit gamma/tau [Saccharospirillum impatiens]|uniref:DNA polymerase III subunit gamma/tau n=1 Tax=Saccharospirillum impatiens TaxID=169438 RepID=UPI0004057402|nr:DNA polymerase III subunit gamma/tau [Saccharospirillum impatiens]